MCHVQGSKTRLQNLLADLDKFRLTGSSRNIHPKVFRENVSFQIWQNLKKNISVGDFLTKLFRKRLQHRRIPVDFAKLLRTPPVAASAAQGVHYLSTGGNLSTLLPQYFVTSQDLFFRETGIFT